MDKLNPKNMVSEELFMQVQAYSAISLGVVVLLEGGYGLLKEHVDIFILWLAFIFAVVNWIRLTVKSVRISKRLPNGSSSGYFWLGHYTDEYLKFVSQRASSASFLIMTCYLVVFWVMDIFGVQKEWVANARVIDHVMPIIGLALISGSLTTLHYLKADEDE